MKREPLRAAAKIAPSNAQAGKKMSDPAHSPIQGEVIEHHDPVDNVVHAIPIVLPVVGGVLMFLLAFIAIYMA